MNSSEKPVAIIGAGAVGLALASAFARTGRPIIICGGREPIQRIVIIESGVTESWPVRHTTTPADLSEVEIAVVAVKAHQTETIGDWLRGLARPETAILIAQNGIEHRQRMQPWIGHAHVVPAVVYLNVERTAPGMAILRRVGEFDLALADDESSRALGAELVHGGMRVSAETDLKTVAWAKLLTNITANPLTALTGRRADVMRDTKIAAIARQLMTEAVQVGQAEGAALTVDHVDRAMRWLQDVPAGSTTSMRQDRLAGRALEYDALTGAVVRAAERHGIDVPANRFVLALLAAIQP